MSPLPPSPQTTVLPPNGDTTPAPPNGDTTPAPPNGDTRPVAFHLESLIEEGAPIPEPRMSVTETMAFYARATDGSDETASQLPTTVSLAQVDLPTPLATTAG